MQTFLPFPSFEQSANALDSPRLGKQRAECLQIVKALLDPTYGWQRHPAVLMWEGSVSTLCDYGMAVCMEWRSRGYRDTVLGKLADLDPLEDEREEPRWAGLAGFHASHQANLLRKDADWYGQWGWPVDPRQPYVWPVVPLSRRLVKWLARFDRHGTSIPVVTTEYAERAFRELEALGLASWGRQSHGYHGRFFDAVWLTAAGKLATTETVCYPSAQQQAAHAALTTTQGN